MGKQNYTLWQRGGVWQLRLRHHGKQIRLSTGCTREADAKRFAINYINTLDDEPGLGPAVHEATFEDLVEAVIDDYQDNGYKTIDRARQAFNNLGEEFSGKKVRRIITSSLQSYSRKRLDQGAAPGTINRELAFMKRGFNLLRIQGQIASVPYIPMLKEANPREGFLEHEQFLLLLESLPDYLRPLVTFGYVTGCRHGEIINLRWSRVDMKRGSVRLEASDTKTSRARTIFLSGLGLAALREAHKHRVLGLDFVFHRGGQPIKDFRVAWKTACEAAGVPGLLFHDLRRTAVRNLVRSGTPERVAMTISGHLSRSTFDRYSITSERDLQEAAVRLDSYFGSQ